MRCMDPEKLERLKDATIKTIRDVVESGGGALEAYPVEGSPAVHVAADHAAVLLAKQAAKNLNLPFELTNTGGCSDGNFFVRLRPALRVTGDWYEQGPYYGRVSARV